VTSQEYQIATDNAESKKNLRSKAVNQPKHYCVKVYSKVTSYSLQTHVYPQYEVQPQEW